ncbi:MAG: ASKHA domain-containing protein [Spirochaetia bacterium]|nr:ASKHA domain-containing protein [Spirochaetia bacterium]
MSTVKVSNGANISSIEVEDGVSLLEAISKIKDMHVDASCGGKGTCGKCKVKILKGSLANPGISEKKYLSAKELENGYRLSCMVPVTGNIDVLVNGINEKSQILTAHNGFTGKLNPLVKKKYLTLVKPSLEDQRSDLSRVLNAIQLVNPEVSLSQRQNIPAILRKADYSVTAVFSSDSLLGIEEGNTENLNYGIAIDIGTTTIAAYLLNFNSGETIDTISGLNSQKIFGADVISRIEYSMQGVGNLKLLQEKILTQVSDLCIFLAERNNISRKNIYSIILAGNTTMLHLFYGIDPAGIAVAPFIPGFLGVMSLPSSVFKDFPLSCIIFSLPSISGYVGADIVAGILATKMHERDELSLLIDIGTNGEIVFGNKEKLYCCSTAAGPAFEGAHISCGLGGIPGAVDSVELSDGQITCSTIGNERAIGICGSGIIDIVAVLLKSGLVDFTGRILDNDEVDGKSKTFLEEMLINRGEPAFLVTKASESGEGKEVVFTQKDIREVQLAKAAISAGILSLLNKAGRDLAEIEHVFIAGGFGSYISKKSAADIGLIPASLLDKTESVGNTAGLGALSCSLSQEDYYTTREIVKKTEYVELSSDSFFNMKYMEEMVFPEY